MRIFPISGDKIVDLDEVVGVGRLYNVYNDSHVAHEVECMDNQLYAVYFKTNSNPMIVDSAAANSIAHAMTFGSAT